MFGDQINNQKQWGKKPFGKFFSSIRYGTSSPPKYRNSGIPFIRATNVKGGYVSKKGLVYISQEEADKISKCKLSEGNLLIVRSGANTGDCCRINEEWSSSYGGFDLIIEIKEPESTFYNYLLNTESAKALLKPLSRRAGQPHLNSKQISDVELLAPPSSLMEDFSKHLVAIEKQKEQVQANVKKSENLFQSLLQKAFKGELVSEETIVS